MKAYFAFSTALKSAPYVELEQCDQVGYLVISIVGQSEQWNFTQKYDHFAKY